MMNILGGNTIEVYRMSGPRNRHGDGVPDLVGTIEHCVFQWATASSTGVKFRASDNFEEISTLAAVVFCPRDHPIKVQARDRLKMDGNTFQVVGQRAWDQTMPVTGYEFGFYMIQVEMVD